MSLNPDDLLAVLEAGPQGVDALVRDLGVGRRELTEALTRLQASGLVTRLSGTGRWALAPAAPAPRPPDRARPTPAAPSAPAASERPTRIVDGVEYEVFTLDELQARLRDAYPRQGASATEVLNVALGAYWRR